MHKFIHQIEEMRQAIFVGFFGPIGVSAIFYLYISLEFLETITVDGEQREDAKRLGDTIMIVVWFLAICSIVSPHFLEQECFLPECRYLGMILKCNSRLSMVCPFLSENLASSSHELFHELSLRTTMNLVLSLSATTVDRRRLLES